MKKKKVLMLLGSICLALVIAVPLLAACGPEEQAEVYPEQDIKVIAPWPEGTGCGAILRKCLALAEPELGVALYVENIEGAISGRGVSTLMGSLPDGYTIGMLTYDGVVTVPRNKLVPEYDLHNLQFIAQFTAEADALVMPKGLYKSFEEFVADAKANPGKIAIGNDGVGSRAHVTTVAMAGALGIEVKHIPFPEGAGGKKQALLSGEVLIHNTSFGDFASVLKSGDAEGLITFGEARNPLYLDVPTWNELYPDNPVIFGSFVIIAGPAGIPADRVAILETALRNAQQSQEFQHWATQEIGVQAPWRGSAELTDWIFKFQKSQLDILADLSSRGIIPPPGG